MNQQSEWRRIQIGQLGQVVTGNTPSTDRPAFYGDKYPFITPSDLRFGSRIVQTERCLSEEGKDAVANRLLPAGAVCFTSIGATIGKMCMTTRPSVTNQQINSIVVEESRHDPRFVYYLLRHSTDQIKALAGGAATPIVSKSKFAQAVVTVPNLPTQRKIAAILSAYDDLIENNTRRIAILEDMAQMLYREWFVHFRFPGHEDVAMVDSELGTLPEGWEVRQLSDVGEIVLGKTPSKKVPEYYGDYIPFIKIPDMHRSVFCIRAEEALSQAGVESQANKTVPANSLCVSCIGTIGLVSITTVPSQTNQQINTIVPEEPDGREFLYFCLCDLKPKMERHGAGATLTYLSKTNFSRLRIVFPADDVLVRFHEMVWPIFEEIRTLQLKNRTLRSARDLLLPRLVSGDLDVSDLEIAHPAARGLDTK